MDSDSEDIKYENDKFLPGENPDENVVNVKVVSDANDAVSALKNVLNDLKKQSHQLENGNQKKMETFRLVINQHGSRGGVNDDIQINKATAKTMLKAIAAAGYSNVKISDLSCYGSTQYYFTKELFEEVMKDTALQSITIRYAEKDRACIAGLKSDGENDRYSFITIGKEGSTQPRKKMVVLKNDSKVSVEPTWWLW
jgi:hypothetical protein